MVEQVVNPSCLSFLIEFFNCYTYPPYGKTYPVAESTSIVVHNQLELYFDIYKSIIPKYICRCKEYWSLCNCDTFLLSNYYHNIIIDGVVRRDIIRYEKTLFEYSQQDSD